LYRRIHAQHHVSEGDLTVFGTADMHLVEAFALTMGFYGALLAFWAWRVRGLEGGVWWPAGVLGMEGEGPGGRLRKGKGTDPEKG
jgi:sterol desaturase/sphingolipid hydroxylase (fatty acid hydroxylase superfamily)